MKNSICIVIFILISGSTFSQGTYTGASNLSPGNGSLIGSDSRYASKAHGGLITYEEARREYDNIGGSPYLMNSKLSIGLFSKNGNLINNVAAYYDLYHDELIAFDSTQNKEIVLDVQHYTSFQFLDKDDKIQLFKRVDWANLNKFYHILYEHDDFTVCSDIKASILVDSNFNPGIDTYAKKFVQKKTYYVIAKNKSKRFQLKKLEFLNDIPFVSRKKLEGIIKEEKIKKIKNEDDLIELLNRL